MKPWEQHRPYRREVGSQGYIEIWVPDSDPFCQGNRKYIRKYGGAVMREHRYVMAKILGRRLRKGETVHHRNGKRADNRPRNLELWTGNHGSGVRVLDQVRRWLDDTPRKKVRVVLRASRHAAIVGVA